METVLSVVTIIATVAAIVSAPLITLRVANRLQETRMRYERKYSIFAILMGERALFATPAAVGALNLIDLEFKEHPNVLASWGKYYALVNTKDFAALNGIQQREQLKVPRAQLLLDIVNVLELKGQFTLEDFERGYFPQALGDPQAIARKIGDAISAGVDKHGAIPIVLVK